MMKILKIIFPNKEIRRYRKMHRKHRKELVKHAKRTSEWDWGWLHDSIIMQVRHMHEYYTQTNNVWQTDETRLSIVKQLQHILDLKTEIDRMQDDKYGGVEFVHEDGKITMIYQDDHMEKAKKRCQKEQELYEELYSSIGKNLRGWWD